MTERITATYRLSSYVPLEEAAEVLAGEQSCGTFTKLPMETADITERHGAHVLRVLPEPAVSVALPGAWNPRNSPTVHVGTVEISFPTENFGTSIVGLLNTVAGNLFELRELASVKLLDIEIPRDFAIHYPGPQFGVDGTRKLVRGTTNRPLIGTIVKPSVGLPLDQLRELVRILATSGIDFIKDDELNGNPPHAPLSERVRIVMEEINRAADVTGKKTMYAFNISDDVETMLRNHDLVATAGGTCVMVTLPTLGLPAVHHLRKRAELPIHGHRAGFGGMGRSNLLGIDYAAYQKLMRTMGADHLHVGGIQSKFYESDNEVLSSIRAIQQPLLDYRPVLPVLSSAQSAATAEATHAAVGSHDIMVLAGGGISGHPDGIDAGVASMQEAWECVAAGQDLGEHAARHPALRKALDFFGGTR